MQDPLLRRRVALFFLASGAAALSYEVVWLRLLGRVFGNTTQALSVVLAAYLGGMGLGSWVLGRFSDRWLRPLRAYGLLEIGIGLYAALTLPLVDLLSAGWVAFARSAQPGPGLSILVRLALSGLLLFLPAFCMGGTLPVLASLATRRGAPLGRSTAFLYGMNTAGAVAGTLLAGFVLLPLLGLKATLMLSVAVNLGVGALALLSSRAAGELEPGGAAPDRAPSRLLLAAFFATGVLAMMLEIGWTRVLAVVLDSSTYAFTIMLATFLAGISLGSLLCGRVLARFGAGGAAWGAGMAAIGLSSLSVLPLFEQVDVATVRLYALTIGSPGLLQAARFALCVGLMALPTLAFGALFPLGAAMHAGRGGSLGVLALANTLGTLAGSLATGFLLIPRLGIHGTLLAAGALSGAIGIGVLLARGRLAPAAALATALALALWTSRGGWDPRRLSVGYHIAPASRVGLSTPQLLSGLFNHRVVFYEEGTHCVVSVFQGLDGRSLKVNAKTDATDSGDMGTQLMLGHLPHLMHPAPRRTLVVGLGSGVTVAAALAHPVERVDCVEIEPAVARASDLFRHVNRDALDDPRTRLVIGDGRNHLLVSEGGYDVVVSEPSNPWIAGVANLFTEEYYRLVRARLAPGGLLCQWMQVYSTTPADLRMVLASIRAAFPSVSVWSVQTGDLLILAGEAPAKLDLDRIQARISASADLRADLARHGVRGAAGLEGLFELGEADVDRWVRGSVLHTDDRLQLEFRAPLTLHENSEALIRGILNRRRRALLPSSGEGGAPGALRLCHLGSAHLARGSIGAARAAFAKALAEGGAPAEALLGLGLCEREGGNFGAARARFAEAARLRPDLAEAQALLGQALLRSGDAAGAAQALDRAVALDPSDAKAQAWRGEAQGRLGRWGEAATAYAAARRLETRVPAHSLALAGALVRAGRPEASLSLMRDFRAFDPVSYEVTSEYVRTCEAAGAGSEAAGVLRERCLGNPHDPRYALDLARLCARMGDEAGRAWASARGRRLSPAFDELMEEGPDER